MRLVLAAVLSLSAAGMAHAAAAPGAPAAPPTTNMAYGAVITPAQAQAFMNAAEAEARRLNQNVSIAIVEPSGDLVMFKRGTGTNYGTSDVVINKAKAAARYRRPTAYWGQVVASGQMYPMTLPGMILSGGGVPIVVGDRIIGAVGVGGGSDDPIAQAGIRALQ